MATTRDRYILDVDTRSATRAVENLKNKINALGGSQTQQRMRQLQQSFDSVKVDALTRQVDQLQRELEQLTRTRADKTIKDLGDQANSARVRVAALAGAAVGLVGAFAANMFGNFIAGARDAAIQMDRVERSLTVFLGSSQRARQEMQRIGALSSEMGIRVEDLSNAFTIFTRFGLDTSSEALRAWTNIALASGKSLDQLGEAVADALTGEFERLKEFGVKVSQENGRFTASIAGQQDIVANSSQELIQRLQALGAAGGAWAGSIEGNANTLEGSMNILSNAVRNAQVAFMEGLEPALIQINLQMAEFLRNNETLITALGGALGDALIVLANAVQLVVSGFQALSVILQNLALAVGITAFATFGSLLLKAAEGGAALGQALRVTGGFALSAARSMPVLGAAISALSGPIGRIIAGLAAFDLALKAIGLEDGLFPNLAAQFGRTVDAIIDDVNRLRGITTITNMPFEDLVNSGLDAQTVLDELNRRYADGIAKLETWQRITMLPGTVERLEAAREVIARLTAEQEAAAQAATDQATSTQRAAQANQAFMNSLKDTPAVEFYKKLIAESQAALSETTNFQSAMQGLNEALRVGAISPDLYAEAMRRLNEQMNQLDPDSYAAYFNNLMESAATGQRETEYLQRAIEELNAAIVGGGTPEELERWRAALAQLTPDSFNAFYSSLIETAQGTVRESDYAKQAIEALNESLSKGVISPEVYAEAMKKLNSSIDSTQIKTYQTVLAELNTTFAESQANAAVNAQAMAALTEQFSNQIISLEQYRAGISALGSSFDEYLLSIGDINAYLQNLQSTVENSMRADENKAAAIRQLTQAYEAGSMAPELYAQMMRALGADIEFTAEQLRRLGDEFSALTGTAEASLTAMEERVRAAQEQAELAGYDGVERALRSIILEENRLRDATIERLRAQALANDVSQDVLNEQIARIEEQTRATIAARQEAARVEEANRRSVEKARELTRPRTSTSRTRTRSEPESLWDRIFGGANAGGGSSGAPDGSKANPFYVIPVFGGLKDMLDNITKRVVNASDLTGNVTGVLQSLSAPIASANRQAGFLGSLFGGYFATGGNIPAGRYGIVGESGPEVVEGPATVTPITGQQVVYNINAVDVRSFQDMLARDPGFVHAVVQRAQRRVPGAR